MKRIYLILFLLLSTVAISFAQDFSNKGKDFWLGYGYHVRYVSGNSPNSQEMVLYFATENMPGRLTNIRIEIPAVGYVETINNIGPGSIATSSRIPKAGFQDARLTTEGTFNTGIHITASRPVVAYAHIYDGSVSGATLLFPTNTLGKDYYSMNYDQVSNEGASNCFFFVVAADTGITTVEITPSASTFTRPANVPFMVTLSQGEIFNVMGNETGGGGGTFNGVDLTGSRIRSISAGGVGCKKIAVFSGSGKIKLECNGDGQGSADNLIAQAFPKTAWGKKFLTAPTANMPFNPYRVGVSNPAAVVRVNGVIQTRLINNFYYDIAVTNQPAVIESDEPVMVAQYITTRGACGNNFLGPSGDPEMIYLSPIEQTIDEVILNSTSFNSITQHWVNVIIKTVAVPSFTITGALNTVNFVPHPQAPLYSYAQINVSQGAHLLSADSGFNAIAYGYGFAESYGYNAGTNIKDLYNFIQPINPLNISGTNSACACTPFFYSITYPYQPLSLHWDFKGFQPNETINNPVADSTYFINGKQVWRYKLPTPYTYCPAGNYPITITAGTTGTDGCGNFQIKDDTLFVRNTPTPEFNWQHNGCVTDSVRFSDTSQYDEGVSSYRWLWDFGDGTTSTEHNPVHKYNAAGNYTVSFSMITNIGCISTIRSKQIVVSDPPIAKFGFSKPTCLNTDIIFSDSSIVPAPGNIFFWHWQMGDGSSITATDNSNLVHQYSATGQKTVSLVLETNSGCRSLPFEMDILVHPNPVPDFVMPEKVCLPYDVASFADASTIADGTESSFSWKWAFGEPSSGRWDSSVSQNPSHLYNSTGPFNIKLTVTSGAGCVMDTTRVFRKVFTKAVSNFMVNAENCFNTSTNFASTANVQGDSIVNWFWDFGDRNFIGNGEIVNHTYAIADTFSVLHWAITDKGCSSDTVKKEVVVHPLPIANFSISPTTCEKTSVTFSDLSLPVSGTINRWVWDFGFGHPDSIVNSGAPIIFRYDTTGNYMVQLSVVNDKGCVSAIPFSTNIVIHPLPKPGFISPEVCLRDASAIFVDSSSIPTPNNIVGWLWDFGDPASGTANTFNGLHATHRYNAIGLYTATLTVTSNSGCSASQSQSFTVNGDVPIADFVTRATPNFCANDSVFIIDNSTVNFGNITKVEIYWDHGAAPLIKEIDDHPFAGKVYSHVYPDFQSPLTRDFSVRYLAYSGTNCVDEEIKTIRVHASPSVQFNTVPPVCLDAVNYQITQAVETGSVPGLGLFSGTGISNNGLFNPSLTGAGIFNVLYTYTSNAGCVDTISGAITVLSPAIANFDISTPACAKNELSFTNVSTIPTGSGAIATWVWNTGDGTPVIQNNSDNPINHAYAIAGSYVATLTLTTTNGCVATVQKDIVVHPLPLPGFTFPASVCLPNATVPFTNTSTIADGSQNTFTYHWDFDDTASGAANTAVGKNPTHVYQSDDIFQVKLICTSGAGCIDSISIPVDIIHPQPTAAIIADSASICQNQTVQFSDNSRGADGIVNKWYWDFGNGSSSHLQFPLAHTYNTAAVYNVVLQVENTWGCKDTAIVPFTVFANPIISAGRDTVLLEGGEITLHATASGNSLQYLWLPAFYLNNNRLLNPVVKGIPADMIYTLQVVAQGGCRNTDDVLVKLLKAPVIPNTFTPNGDGINDTWVILHLESYPNCRLRVFNRNGQAVYESVGYQVPGWNGTFKGSKLPFGTYYYVIEPGSGRKPITGFVTLVY